MTNCDNNMMPGTDSKNNALFICASAMDSRVGIGIGSGERGKEVAHQTTQTQFRCAFAPMEIHMLSDKDGPSNPFPTYEQSDSCEMHYSKAKKGSRVCMYYE